ncbi:MAG TPA: bifunctional helix-turn-helix transcriptional regulator/GNAT family N-acetyltransferase [Caulobacteraceae bacterium]|jgi:DNA-binding MarR family transcriptional regulator/N-acetylglutamate synthase-like GNAT family acetyltransferase|nr:bifunctional helix-turn-helix transcriptional regulator/GNAT family N-acetyltransferase [Caulobacteraceae bacterium]
MTRDVLRERPALFLASRLKRLAERMQGDVISLAADAGVGIQPAQYSLLATLDRFGPQTIGELTQAMELSQPSVTRMAAKLAQMGLVTIDRLHKDQRHKTVSLTPAGVADLERSKLHVWPQVEAAVGDMLTGLNGPLLDQIDAIERMLAETPLSRRAKARAEAGLTIREFSDSLAPAFRDINAQWIRSMYRLEQTDLDVLENPRERIIDKGGDILFVEATGLGMVGACALLKTGEDQYELTKMGVLESARGRKVGEFLLKAVIARALRMGAKRLYLLSNKKSAAAIHLYEKLGFQHDDAIMREFGARYERCDVAMLYRPPG